ncbi:hypothetical protein SK3146_00203 [Paenibacillus konkukensis]|uniref:Uncharacterized protein n=1 Tax=Paenibacillus konkukensis TaxID=2020716 RepID=A0ABY4RF59_9BACL|nr:hypothetical protein [Paenibacillus konkukensis]UQZ81047.1 hypothetical protein SK3146_00203 [Paenibacillus konkukensis]
MPYRPEDLPYLHRFLADSLARADWQSELVRSAECHAVLDEIARHSPEGICIVRSDSGTPLGFCAGLRLHALSAPLLERYAPSFFPLLGEEGPVYRDVSPEAADTLCVLLAAVDVDQSLYSPEELGALLMQQWLIHMTGGWRGIIVTADPQMSALLPILGFQAKNENLLRQADSAANEMTRWELDFRHITFDEWVQLIIRQTGPAGTIGGHGEEGPRFGRGMEIKIDASEAKQILQQLFQVEELEQLHVIRQLHIPGAAVRACVQAVLTAENPPLPLTQLEQRILRESFLHKALNKNQLAEAFHMSRTTFYRQTLQAVSHLAHVLTQLLASSR